jgi:uncharacterized membrane protein
VSAVEPVPPTPGPDPIERTVARLLTLGTYAAVALLAIGTVAMLVAGHSPLEGGPPLDPPRLPFDLLPAPEGFLWFGLLAVIATPSARVAAALVGYLRTREQAMAVVAALILGIIALSVSLAIGTEG